MKSGYKIFWSENALEELANTIKYLEENFSEKELIKLAENIEKTSKLLSKNPFIFQSTSSSKNIRRAVVLSFNSIFYRINDESIEILSFFANRQNPKKNKLD
jgi:plasmid stabilization system protein ParE